MMSLLTPLTYPLGYTLSPWLYPRSGELEANRMLDLFFDDTLTPRMRDFTGQLKIHDNGDFEYRVDASGFRPEEVFF